MTDVFSTFLETPDVLDAFDRVLSGQARSEAQPTEAELKAIAFAQVGSHEAQAGPAAQDEATGESRLDRITRLTREQYRNADRDALAATVNALLDLQVENGHLSAPFVGYDDDAEATEDDTESEGW